MVRVLRSLAIVFVATSTACFVDGGDSMPTDDDESGSTSSADTTGPMITDGITDGVTAGSISATATATMSTTPTTTADTEDSDSTSTTNDSTSTGPEPETDDAADESSSGSTGSENLLTVEELLPGDLVITEMMGNPNCTADNCEWFEVLNDTDLPIDLFGLGIGDRDDIDLGTPGAVVSDRVILEPGALGVFARVTLWPYEGVEEPLVRYPNTVALSNNEFDTIGLFGAGNLLLDEAAGFLGDNEHNGRSRKLRPEFWNHNDNNQSENWCWSDTPLPSTSTSDDWGTPGFDADDCLVE